MLILQEMVEPIFESIKPPAIGTLEFAKLQFGDAPIRVEAVRMDRDRRDGVYLEMDIRWAGEPEVKLKVGVSAYVCPSFPSFNTHAIASC
jgi:hypothetical protein